MDWVICVDVPVSFVPVLLRHLRNDFVVKNNLQLGLHENCFMLGTWWKLSLDKIEIQTPDIPRQQIIRFNKIVHQVNNSVGVAVMDEANLLDHLMKQKWNFVKIDRKKGTVKYSAALSSASIQKDEITATPSTPENLDHRNLCLEFACKNESDQATPIRLSLSKSEKELIQHQVWNSFLDFSPSFHVV